jgi:hypothetical protein
MTHTVRYRVFDSGSENVLGLFGGVGHHAILEAGARSKENKNREAGW